VYFIFLKWISFGGSRMDTGMRICHRVVDAFGWDGALWLRKRMVRPKIKANENRTNHGQWITALLPQARAFD